MDLCSCEIKFVQLKCTVNILLCLLGLEEGKGHYGWRGMERKAGSAVVKILKRPSRDLHIIKNDIGNYLLWAYVVYVEKCSNALIGHKTRNGHIKA